MVEAAALLVDHVLSAVGYRQWMLSFAGSMAVRLGYGQTLLVTAAESLARAVMQDMWWSVKERHNVASVEALHTLHCLITAVPSRNAAATCASCRRRRRETTTEATA